MTYKFLISGDVSAIYIAGIVLVFHRNTLNIYDIVTESRVIM
jgi:hypothetical protein